MIARLVAPFFLKLKASANIFSAFVFMIGFAIIPLSMFLVIYAHLSLFWCLVTTAILTIMYVVGVGLYSYGDKDDYIVGLFLNSERALLVLVGLLALNYLALHSHTIEAFIEKATQ